MSTRFADREYAALPVLFPVRKTVPGFLGTQLLTAFSDNTFVVLSLETESRPKWGSYTLSNALANVSVGCTFFAGAGEYGEYGADFVAEVLAADAAKPEAAFDNVVDMLGWLNRE